MSAGDGGADRTWALPVLAVLLLVLGGTAGAWGYHTFVLTSGDTLEVNVQAGATVDENAAANTVTVTFTSNQNADHLLVTVESESALRVANTSADAEGTDEGVRLPAVGDRVIYEQRRPAENATVEVIVTAVEGEARNVVVAKEVEL